MKESIEKLIAENKSRFEINKIELAKRIGQAIDIYTLVKPTLNLIQESHCKIGKYYRNMHELIKDSAQYLHEGYTLDTKLTKASANKLNIYYLKPQELQVKEKAKLKKKIKALYLEELNDSKQLWLLEVTSEAAKQAELEAVKEAGLKAKKLQESLLALMQ